MTMESKTTENLAASLRKGQLPDAQTWDIAAAVRLIADALGGPGTVVTVGEVRAAAKVVNQRMHFDHTRMLGEAWLDRRGFDATVTKHHAQALINLSSLDAAEKLLRDGLKQILPGAGAQAASELPEYEGLLGRVYKQRFVLTRNLDFLVESTKLYRSQYESNPARPFWHGINVAALLARQEREGIPGVGAEVVSLATAIYEKVTQLFAKGRGDQWAAATASEACLALDRCDDAELWLYRFLHHPRLEPFDTDSYSRQIREIWQGDQAAGGSGNCADRLAAIMTRHIARTQRRWSLSPSEVKTLSNDPDALERNFSGESTFSLESVKNLLAACSSIGCVCSSKGERLGTGFLVSGSWLKESFGNGSVFVTNAHVISDTVTNAIRQADACVTFEVESVSLDQPKFYRVRELLFTSAPGDLGSSNDDRLDVTVVRLDGLTDALRSLTAAANLPLIDPKSKAFVVGHPRGSGLQISLHDSVLLDIDDEGRLVHYRTPTDPGSSGSPVFNSQWEVIAVHHGGSATTPRLRGSGRYEANEGIALSAGGKD
jgi:S1-C subfamily serine protease